MHEWREEGLVPFDELMVAWNGARPSAGRYLISVSVKGDEWTPWLLYAAWASDGQMSFSSETLGGRVRLFQDALELKGERATAFQIKIEAEGGASLESIHALHVYTNGDRIDEPRPMPEVAKAIYLPVPGLSEMALDHVRHKDLCSPTSTTATLRYLSGRLIDPLHFAASVWDGGFDIFGNWVLNVAQGASELGSSWNCWVERLDGFDAIYSRLLRGVPVVTSIRGPLPGSALPYARGHLVVIIGFDPLEKKVFCMDPAFPRDEETHVSYDLDDFVQAWQRRGRVAYIFEKV